MLLTVYYMAATLLQSFRLKGFLAKIAKQLNERVSVVFYHIPDQSKGKCNCPSELHVIHLCPP